MTTKEWILNETLEKNTQTELDVFSPLLQSLLLRQGVKTIVEANNYLNPSYERDLHDPLLYKDMEKAVKRIIKAIEQKEKIIIFGDYDADGIPGSVVLESFFKKIGYNDFEVYIPDRHLEAHGLSEEKVREFLENKVSLIITIDCGVSSVEAIETAKKLGIDVIVTDHHLVGEKLPPAYAIIDAKQNDDEYPFKMLAGAGVAFKLVCAILAIDRFNVPEGWEKWLLDLVAIATVSDMVPMIGENRVLTHFGIKVLRQTKRPGLLALLSVLKIKPEFVVEEDIGFMIGPHLNAAGRMSKACESYYLLSTKDEVEAMTLARHLAEKNKERKELVEIINQEIENKIDEKNLPAVLVFGNPQWGMGVLGFAAGRLAEKYNRSVFLWSANSNGEIKGSCRSDGSVNLVELMTLAGGKDYFSMFGGHAPAAGFSLVEGQVGELEKRLLSAYEQIDKLETKTAIPIDGELSLEDVDWSNFYEIEKIGPFGVGNPRPVFLFKNVKLEAVKTFGNGGIHLELTFKNIKGKNILAIGFFACPAKILEQIKSSTDLPKEKFDGKNGHNFLDANLTPDHYIDLLASLEKSTFKNFPELRLRIVDIKNPS